MASQTIYVVMGTTGEYSDRSEWAVKAFFEQQEAESLVSAAKARAAEIEATRNSIYDRPTNGSNEHDPCMHMDYTGTDYYIMEVDLVGADETVASVLAAELKRFERAIDLKGERL